MAASAPICPPCLCRGGPGESGGSGQLNLAFIVGVWYAALNPQCASEKELCVALPRWPFVHLDPL